MRGTLPRLRAAIRGTGAARLRGPGMGGAVRVRGAVAW